METPHFDQDQIRDQQRQLWQARAQLWGEERARTRGAQSEPDPIALRLMELAAIKEGDRVLDLACGIGDPSFQIAERVGTEGHVLGVDFSEAMIAGATALAAEHGITNATFQPIANERELAVPPASFDAAVCQCGLMYMPDRVGAVQAILAALKPGARLAVCTWGPAEHSPQALFVYALANLHFDAPLPPADALAEAFVAQSIPSRKQLEAMFLAAGYRAIASETSIYLTIQEATPEAFWSIIESQSSIATRLLADQPDAVRQAIREDAVRLLGRMFPEGGIRLGSEVVFASGMKPE